MKRLFWRMPALHPTSTILTVQNWERIKMEWEITHAEGEGDKPGSDDANGGFYSPDSLEAQDYGDVT